MGTIKVIVKGDALYDGRSGKLIKNGLPTQRGKKLFAALNKIFLPVLDFEGQPWLFDGKQVYCLPGDKYETLYDEAVHLAPCPGCGGMGMSKGVNGKTEWYSLYPMWFGI